MDEEQAVDGSDKSFTRSWKFLKDAFKKRLEPKSRRTSIGSPNGSTTESTRDGVPISRSSSSSVKQRFQKGPLSALYKPKPFKVPRYTINVSSSAAPLELPFTLPLTNKRFHSQHKDLAGRCGK